METPDTTKDRMDHSACVSGDVARVKQCLDEGADVNARDWLEFTPLMEATINGYAELTQLLIERGADVHARTYADETDPDNDPGGDTALMLVVQCWNSTYDNTDKHVKTARLLLEAGADINAKNPDENTALFFAFRNRHYDMLRLLAEWGANVEEQSLFNFLPYYSEMLTLSAWSRRKNLLILRKSLRKGEDGFDENGDPFE